MKSTESSRPPMGKKSLSSRFLEKLGVKKSSSDKKLSSNSDQKIDSTLLNRTQTDQLYLKSNTKRKNSDPIHSTPTMITQGSHISNSDHGVYLERTTTTTPPQAPQGPQANDILNIMSLEKEIQSQKRSSSHPPTPPLQSGDDEQIIQRENSRMSSVSSLTATSPENSPIKPNIEGRNKLRMENHSRSRDDFYSSSDSEGEAPLATLKLPAATKFVKKDEKTSMKQSTTPKRENHPASVTAPSPLTAPAPTSDDPGERLKQRIAVMNSYIRRTSNANSQSAETPPANPPAKEESLFAPVAAVPVASVSVSDSPKGKTASLVIPPLSLMKTQIDNEEKEIVDSPSQSGFTDLTQDEDEGEGKEEEEEEGSEEEEGAEHNGVEDNRSADQEGEHGVEEGLEERVSWMEDSAEFEDEARGVNERSNDSPMLRQEDTLSFRTLSSDSQPDPDYSSEVNEKALTPAAVTAGESREEGADDQSNSHNNITDSTLFAERFIPQTPSSANHSRSQSHSKFQSPLLMAGAGTGTGSDNPLGTLADLSPVVHYPPQHSLSFISEGGVDSDSHRDDDEDDDDNDTLFNSSVALSDSSLLLSPLTPSLLPPPSSAGAVGAALPLLSLEDETRNSLESNISSSSDHNSLKKISNLNELLFADESPIASPAPSPLSRFLLEEPHNDNGTQEQQQQQGEGGKDEKDKGKEEIRPIGGLQYKGSHTTETAAELEDEQTARERVVRFAKIIEDDQLAENEMTPEVWKEMVPPVARESQEQEKQQEERKDKMPKTEIATAEANAKVEVETMTNVGAEEVAEVSETETEGKTEGELSLPNGSLSPPTTIMSVVARRMEQEEKEEPGESDNMENKEEPNPLKDQTQKPIQHEQQQREQRDGQERGQKGEEEEEIEKYFKLGGLLAQTSNLATHSNDELLLGEQTRNESNPREYQNTNPFPTNTNSHSRSHRIARSPATATPRSWNSFSSPASFTSSFAFPSGSSSGYQIISLPAPAPPSRLSSSSSFPSSSSFMPTTPKKHLRFSPNLHSQPSIYLSPIPDAPPPQQSESELQHSSRRWSPKYSRSRSLYSQPSASALLPTPPSASEDLDSLYFFLGNVYAGVSVKCSLPQHEPPSPSS